MVHTETWDPERSLLVTLARASIGRALQCERAG